MPLMPERPPAAENHAAHWILQLQEMQLHLSERRGRWNTEVLELFFTGQPTSRRADVSESALQAQVERGAAEGQQKAEILPGLQTQVKHAKAHVLVELVQTCESKVCASLLRSFGTGFVHIFDRSYIGQQKRTGRVPDVKTNLVRLALSARN